MNGPFTIDDEEEASSPQSVVNPPTMNKKKKPKKRKPLPPPSFHPDTMFCGECTDCVQPERVAPLEIITDADVVMMEDNDDDDDDKNNVNNKGNSLRTKVVVDNLDCPSQVIIIQALLKPLRGVTRVMVKVEEKEVYVDHDAGGEPDNFVSTLQEMGYFARLSTDNDGNGMPSLVKSQFYVKGICCASEVPSIHKILKPIPGVKKIQINITTKMVYVQHSPQQIDAHEIAMALHGQGFDSQVCKDGAVRKEPAANVGRTTLHVDNVLVKSDILPIQQQLSSLAGIKRVGVNTAESVVYIEHDVSKVKAKTIRETLAPLYSNSIAGDAEDEIAQRTSTALTVARSKYVESTLAMSNLTLQHIPLLEKTIRQNYIPAQLRAFYPHVVSKTVKLEHNPQLLQAEAVATLMRRYGMETRVAVDGAIEGLALPLLEDYDTPVYGGMQEEEHNSLRINVILSGLFWFISVLSFIGGDWEYLEYCGLFSVLFGLPPIAIKAWKTLMRCQFDANCMMVTAAVGALALEEFDEAASVSFLFAVSEFLEIKATARARKALGAIISLRPDHANVIHPITKEMVVVPADKVPVGSLITVRTGDKVAADGVVVEGATSVDESSLTGESLPVTKRVDDSVSGGSINIGNSPLVVKTVSSVEDSAVSRLIRLVEEAQSNRSETEKMVDTMARTYTPIVVTMALFMCTIPWIWGPETGRYWTLNGLIIIVVACPCAITISTPVTYAAGLAATAQRGVIAKGGASLEALGSVDKVLLDKTGTLTQGNFVISKLETIGDAMSRQAMLELLALIESPSSHPLSSTLVSAARKEGVYVPKHLSMTNHTVLKGEGVSAFIDGKMVYAGNRRLFKRLGMFDMLSMSKKMMTDGWSSEGGTVGFVGVEGTGIIGAFCVVDAVRDEAKDVVRQLMDGGIEVIMLTGDGDGAAQAVAREIGLPASQVHSQLLPEDKLHFVGGQISPPPKRCGACAAKSLVLMVGDGINDAPALAAADVGVAMGEGASLAMEMSDITLMDSNLSKLVFTMKMGTRVVMTIQENLLLSVVAKLLVVGLTFGGKMTLLAAIAADVGVMLIVTLNGMKLLPSGREPPKLSKRRSTKSTYDEVPKDVDTDAHESSIELV